MPKSKMPRAGKIGGNQGGCFGLEISNGKSILEYKAKLNKILLRH